MTRPVFHMPIDKKTIRNYALQNALKYGGKANPGAVIGKILTESPEAKQDIKDIQKQVMAIIQDVNKLAVEKQRQELEKNAPELLEEKKKEEKKELPELEPVDGKIVMRFEPSPSGPLHIGHAYVLGLNAEFCRQYKGKLILRIADTNADNIYVPAYEMIPEDARWLCGSLVKEVIVQSDNLERYYTHALTLLEKHHAYICTCSQEEFKEYVTKKAACPCRTLTVDENLKRWKKMFAEYKEGDAVMRLKTDIKHKNPAMRDFPLMRINETEHPRQGKKYKVWSLMNFSVACDDHEEGVTHILRGKDHVDNAKRQEWLQKYMGWLIPHTLFVGRINFTGMDVSCTKTRKLIEEGVFTGWDDIRVPFLIALRKRGYQQQAFIRYALDVGVTLTDKTVSREEFFKVIDAHNRDVIDPVSHRYFFVQDPVEVHIDRAPKQKVELNLHPDNRKGGRMFVTSTDFYLAAKDAEQIKEDELIRLMECLNFRRKKKTYTFDSQEYEHYKKEGGKIVHWLPKDADNAAVEVVMPDNTIVAGLAEEGVKRLNEGDIVQFERFGFVRLDNIASSKLTFWFAHK